MRELISLLIYFVPLIYIFIDSKKKNESIYWGIGAIFFPIILPIIYYIVVSKKYKSRINKESKYNSNQISPSPVVGCLSNKIATTKNTNSQSTKEKGKALRSFTTNVAGTKYTNKDGTSRQEILQSCYEGEELLLVREYDNPKDPNAVMVFTLDMEQIGYLFAEEAAEIAPRLDKGSPVDAEIVELSESDTGVIYCRIKLTKYSMR